MRTESQEQAGSERRPAARACSCRSRGCCSGAARGGRGRRPPPPSSARRSEGAPPCQRGPRLGLHRYCCWRRPRRRRPSHRRCLRPLCCPPPAQVQMQPSQPQTGGCSLRQCLRLRRLLARPVAAQLLRGGCRAGPARPAQRRHPTWSASDGGHPNSLMGGGPGAGGFLASRDAGNLERFSGPGLTAEDYARSRQTTANSEAAHHEPEVATA